MNNYKTTARFAVNELHNVLMDMYVTLGESEEEAYDHAKRNVCLRLGMNAETFDSITMSDEED